MAKISDLDKQLQKLAKEVSAKNAKVDQVAKKVDEASQKIESVVQEIASRQDASESLTETVESGNLKIQSLIDQMALFKARFEEESGSDTKNNGMGAVTVGLSTANQRLDSFKNELSRVNESIFLLRSEESVINEKLERHDEVIAGTKSKIDSLASDSIPVLTRQLESFEKEFQSWGDKIHAISESVSMISPKIETISTSNDSSNGLEEKLVWISKRLDSLEKSVAESSSKIGVLQASIEKKQVPLKSRRSLIEMDDEF